jgi:hypothetical protein
VTQLESSIDALIQAIQAAMSGRVPVGLVPPILHGIMKNVSLILPEGLELAAGSDYGSTAWYYEIVKTTLVSGPRGFFLILSFPLKDVNREFTLFRIYTFPTKVLNGTFMGYQTEGAFFAVSLLQHAPAPKQWLPTLY